MYDLHALDSALYYFLFEPQLQQYGNSAKNARCEHSTTSHKIVIHIQDWLGV